MADVEAARQSDSITCYVLANHMYFFFINQYFCFGATCIIYAVRCMPHNGSIELSITLPQSVITCMLGVVGSDSVCTAYDGAVASAVRCEMLFLLQAHYHICCGVYLRQH